MAAEAYKPTDEVRKTVSELTSFGVPQENIARIIGISVPTLVKYYRDEIDLATDKANAEVAKTLFQMAKSGETPSATFFWLKTRARWRETDKEDGSQGIINQTIVNNVLPD